MGACKSSPNVENPQQELDRLNEQIRNEWQEPTLSKPPLEIFNREIEKSSILQVLNRDPQVNVIVGGPNCGKTTLLTYVFNLQKFEKKIHLISWNLRF